MIELIASYLTKAIQTRQLQSVNVQVIARTFEYNLIVMANIEEPLEEPVKFIEDVVDVLLVSK